MRLGLLQGRVELLRACWSLLRWAMRGKGPVPCSSSSPAPPFAQRETPELIVRSNPARATKNDAVWCLGTT